MRPRHPLLRDRIAGIDIVEATGETLVLPSTSAVLGMQFRGRVRAGETMLTPAGITGLQSKARTYSYLADTASVLVRFTPQGASCLGIPVSELAGKNVSLDALLPPAIVGESSERVAAAATNAERIAIVEELLARLPYVADAVVARAIASLDSGNGDGVAKIARDLGLSERQLERRFLHRVGVSPKRFAVLRRFERAVAFAKELPTLTEAAHAAGYFDQSHFVRDFRHFTGQSPRSILMSGSSKSLRG